MTRTGAHAASRPPWRLSGELATSVAAEQRLRLSLGLGLGGQWAVISSRPGPGALEVSVDYGLGTQAALLKNLSS